jgi:hypothetical protein
LAVALCAACGKHEAGKPAQDAAKPVATPLAMPPLGLDHVSRFGYYEGPGLATAQAKAKAKDWSGALEAARALLTTDPSSLAAHRLFAAALAQTGDAAAAVDHLVLALGADYYYFASTLADPDLATFRATPHGREIADLAQQIHDEYAHRVALGLWVVARRAPFKWPDKPGPEPHSRGELYAYDRTSRRFFRLTHTEHHVLGFVRAPTGNEVALLGFDPVDYDKTGDAPPVLGHAWVQLVDTVEWKPIGARAVLPSAREVSVGYGNGGQVLVSTAPATGRWTVGDTTLSVLDRASGKLTKVDAPLPAPRIVASLDEGRIVRLPSVDATWSSDPATTASFQAPGGAAIAVPESGETVQATVAVAPDRSRVAFATAVDPCAKDTAPSLYVVEAKTAALRHLLTARSRFDTRWVDATTLAYDDGDGAVRLWSPTTGRQVDKLAETGGVVLDVLSAQNGPVCKQATAETGSGSGSGSGSDELPPEEPAQ